jgi:hypothetical protein
MVQGVGPEFKLQYLKKKLRGGSYWIQVGPESNMLGVLIRKGTFRYISTQEEGHVTMEASLE